MHWGGKKTTCSSTTARIKEPAQPHREVAVVWAHLRAGVRRCNQQHAVRLADAQAGPGAHFAVCLQNDEPANGHLALPHSQGQYDPETTADAAGADVES